MRRLQSSCKVGGTYPDELVFRSGGKVSPIRTKADTSDVQVSILVHRIVLKIRHLIARNHIEYLRGPIATRGHVLSVMAESNATDDAFVWKIMDQFHVQDPLNARIENCKPVRAFSLLVRAHPIRIKIGQSIAHVAQLLRRRGWSWTRNLRRCSGVRIRRLSGLLWRSRARDPSCVATFSGPR